MTTDRNTLIGGAVEAVVVFCAVVGFFALMSVFGLFPGKRRRCCFRARRLRLLSLRPPRPRPLRAGGADGMKVRVTVMPKAGVLDPQGKAIGHALGSLGFGGVGEVRAGKVIELELAETEPAAAVAAAEDMARRLLANTVIESFRVEVA
jgi:phosphoribosylformylglycinamidine synthase